MTIPIITNLPASTQPRSEFNTKVDGLFPQLNTSIAAMNAEIESVNSNTISASLASTQAQAASVSASAIANYRGLWSSLSGALAIPASVFHAERFWLLKSNTANVALIEPGVSAQWQEVENTRAPMPKVRPSILCDIENTETIDPRWTFTRASTATRFNKMGYRETVPSGQPRLNYDPITRDCGWLLEPATTNNLLHSNDFTNAVWVKNNCTVTANNALGADNTLSASTLAFAGGVMGGIRQDITASGTSSQTLSFDIGSADCNNITLSISWFGSSNQNISAGFNLINGTFINLTSNGATVEGWSIEPLKNGLFRVSISGTGTNAANTLVAFGLLENVATACSVVVSSSQGEPLAVPTSYTGHTTTSAVTRASESGAQLSGTSFTNAYNQNEGTLVAEMVAVNTAVSVLASNVQFSNAGATSFISLRNGANANLARADGLIITGGVTQSDFDDVIISANQNITQAIAYKNNDTAYSINGAGLQTDNSATIPTDMNRLVITIQMPTLIKRLAYYPVRPINDEVLSLTRN
jgi:hypothetical protein